MFYFFVIIILVIKLLLVIKTLSKTFFMSGWLSRLCATSFQYNDNGNTLMISVLVRYTMPLSVIIKTNVGFRSDKLRNVCHCCLKVTFCLHFIISWYLHNIKTIIMSSETYKNGNEMISLHAHCNSMQHNIYIITSSVKPLTIWPPWRRVLIVLYRTWENDFIVIFVIDIHRP